MNDHPAAEKSEFEAQIKDLESKFNPIMARVYQQSGGPSTGGMGGQSTGGSGGNTTSKADEVD